jgi:hypothetical protein
MEGTTGLEPTASAFFPANCLAFRNGQIEIETAQLNLNVKPEWQFQTRAIVNWGKIFLRSRK